MPLISLHAEVKFKASLVLSENQAEYFTNLTQQKWSSLLSRVNPRLALTKREFVASDFLETSETLR